MEGSDKYMSEKELTTYDLVEKYIEEISPGKSAEEKEKLLISSILMFIRA